jgi:putative DNA primase/helicase
MADREVNENLVQAEGYEEPIVVAIQRLADMAPVEYERIRKDEAKRLNMRTSVLDREVNALRKNGQAEDDLGLFEPDPWPEEVDGDDLLDRIVCALCRHVVMPAHAAEATALWVVHAHAFECWRHTPRLGVLAPEKECGKSTLLDVLSCLVPRAVKTENLSTAVMFRLVDKHRPTLLVDEFDTFLRDNEELRGALNAGHARGGAHLRCEGDDNKVRAFKTFAPAALAGIGRLPETLADRSVLITLQKRKPDEFVQDFRDDRADHLRDLASRASKWAQDHQHDLRQSEPIMPAGIHNRRADNWRPLLSIADLAGGEWPERARRAAIALSSKTDDTDSIRVQLLVDIRTIFDSTGKDRLMSEELVEHLHKMEDRLWPEYGKRSQPISKNQVARLLKPFTISPGTIRCGETTGKGYKLSKFDDVFARYLPSQTVTTSHVNATAGLSPISKRHKDEDVTVGNSLKATDSAGCDGVTVEMGGVPPRTRYQADSDGNLEEREAIQAIDGEAAKCVHCGEFVGLDEPSVPCDDRVLHEHCHDAHFGFEH